MHAPLSFKSGLPRFSCETFLQVKPLDQTVYKEDYRVGEVARPELTGHSNDTVADASMNSQPSLSVCSSSENSSWTT